MTRRKCRCTAVKAREKGCVRSTSEINKRDRVASSSTRVTLVRGGRGERPYRSAAARRRAKNVKRVVSYALIIHAKDCEKMIKARSAPRLVQPEVFIGPRDAE